MRLCRRWRADPFRPATLHCVALSLHPPRAACSPPDLADPQTRDLAHSLQTQTHALTPGQHRLRFESGRIVLTLCIGEPLALLREQQFEADAVVLAGASADAWFVKALTRCCRRGTQLEVDSALATLAHCLPSGGFEPVSVITGDVQVQHWIFNPRWQSNTSREVWRQARAPAQTCAVIGAGLAGASVAAALAQRGWQVQVFDQADEPASGASGLPVGLAAPHVSRGDCVLSRLSRSGVRMTLQQARERLQIGLDWSPSGVLAYWPDDTATEQAAPAWHAQAAWIKPASLVRAWLTHPRICFTGSRAVGTLRRVSTGWLLLGPAGQPIATANRVILASAGDAVALLQRTQQLDPAAGLDLRQLPTAHGVRGLVSWGTHQQSETRPFPEGPANGSGSLIPFVPFASDRCWFVGSSYQPLALPERSDDGNHQANLNRLHRLLPDLADALTPLFDAGAVNAWKGVRCVSSDRLPLVGALHDADQSLWLLTALGSRGLSLAWLCAELLAARWAGEPLPVTASLARALNARRGKT